MLETDEVDQDYFTPAASTSLANLFDNSSKLEEKSANNSLKYPPPKPQVQKPGVSDNKVDLAPIFKCSLIGHQWKNKFYSPKGTIGCSILKVTKDSKREGELLMVLFNSNKQTLSSISLTPKLEVTIKDINAISFYENSVSFWCLCGSEEDISRLLDYFKSKNVQLIVLRDNVLNPPEFCKNSKNDKSDFETVTDIEETEITKSKASIKSRMANMGKAVLPKPDNSTSSSEEAYDDKKKKNEVIHKKTLFVPKRSVVEQKKTKLSLSTQVSADTGQPPHNILESNDDLLVALGNINVDTGAMATNNINLFFTEQRISNSELRINVTRISDKVDKLLNFIESDNKAEGKNINTEILLKLLKEYENKIKTYEKLLKENTTMKTTETEMSSTSLDIGDENIVTHDEILKLQKIIKQKDNELTLLNNKIKALEHSNDAQVSNQEKDGLTIHSDLEQLVVAKNKEIEKLTKENEKFTAENNALISSQIKQIMNDTFHSIVANFKEDENYSCEDIRLIVGKVIKNVTLVSLK